jgi:hypothetical protein
MLRAIKRFYRHWIRPTKKYRWRVTVYYYLSGPINIFHCKAYRNLHWAKLMAKWHSKNADLCVYELFRIQWGIRKEERTLKTCKQTHNCRDCKYYKGEQYE